MTSFKTIHGETAELSTNTLASFAGRFRGALIRETDGAYDRTRRVWNGLINKRPALIAQCTGVADNSTNQSFAVYRSTDFFNNIGAQR